MKSKTKSLFLPALLFFIALFATGCARTAQAQQAQRTLTPADVPDGIITNVEFIRAVNEQQTLAEPRFLYLDDYAPFLNDSKCGWLVEYQDDDKSIGDMTFGELMENLSQMNDFEFRKPFVDMSRPENKRAVFAMKKLFLGGWHFRLLNQRLSDLTEIEYFVGLESLFCNANALTTLDVSKNPVLKRLSCSVNFNLVSLDVSKNPVLEWLDCRWNNLPSLDVSNNPVLEWLCCTRNQLTSLDVTKNSALEVLYCGSNQLTSLDVSKNPALKHLGCGGNQLTSLDVSNNPALESLGCGGNQLTSLDISKNPALESLSCDGNQLTSLDVSKNPALTTLECGGQKDAAGNPQTLTVFITAEQEGKIDIIGKDAAGNPQALKVFITAEQERKIDIICDNVKIVIVEE